MRHYKAIARRSRNRIELPSLAKEGCLRPSRKFGAASIAGADGVVGSSHRLSVVERTTPAAPSTEGDHLLMARPPLLGQGGEFHSVASSPLRGNYHLVMWWHKFYGFRQIALQSPQ